MNTTTIKTCPDCSSEMKLYTEGKYQGIYECTGCSYSESCEHQATEPELAYSDRPPFCVYVEVCTDCGLEVRDDE